MEIIIINPSGTKLMPLKSKHFNSFFAFIGAMRIFFITHTYSLGGSGGGEQFVSSYLKQLRKRGHEVFVFTTASADYSAQEKALGLSVFKAKCWGHHAFHKFEYLLQRGKAVELAREFKADIIHAQNDAFPGLIGQHVKKKLGIPMVLAVEYLSDTAVSINLKIVFALNKFFLPRIAFDKIVSWSTLVMDKFMLPWGIPRDKIALIPGGLDLSRFKNLPSPAQTRKKFGKNLIVSIKPLHSTNAKGISYIIKAMKIVSQKHPKFKYIIFGDGKARQELESLVKEIGLEKNVLFAGGVENSTVPEIYSSADIVAHSFAFKATTSIALIESMAAAKAIVATDSGEVSKTAQGSVKLVKPKNYGSIASGIIELIENRALRVQLGKRARSVAEKNYSIESVASKFEKIYSELVSGKR